VDGELRSVELTTNIQEQEPATNLQEQQNLVLETMWHDRKFADMCIMAEEGYEIPCHRCVLASQSPVLGAMLSSEMLEGSQKKVSLHNVVLDDASMFVEYLYTNRLSATMSPLTASVLLQLGDMYQIPDLVDKCADALQSSLTKDCVGLVVHSLYLHYELYPKVHAALRAVVDRIRDEETLIWELCYLATPRAVHAVACSSIATQTCDSLALDHIEPDAQFDTPPQTANNIGSPPDYPPHHCDEDSEGKPHTEVDPSAAGEMFEGSVYQDGEPILEVPAEIDECEAGYIQHERWATAVEAQIAKDFGPTEGHEGEPDGQSVPSCIDDPAGVPIVILAFNKHPDLLTETVMKSQWGQQFATKGIQVRPDWARGAKIFVEGLTQDVLEQTGTLASELRPWHVIILEQDREHVHAALESLSYRVKPRVKSTTSHIVALDVLKDGVSTSAGTDGAEESSPINLSDIAMVKRTFISIPVPSMLSPRSQYTHSSTDRLGIGNPRVWGPNSS
jgi:hypothetical protein